MTTSSSNVQDVLTLAGGCQCSLLRYRITIPHPASTCRTETDPKNPSGTGDNTGRIGFTHCYCSICRLSVSAPTRTALFLPFANVEFATRAKLTEANARRHSKSLSIVSNWHTQQETYSSQDEFVNVDTPSGCCTVRGGYSLDTGGESATASSTTAPRPQAVNPRSTVEAPLFPLTIAASGTPSSPRETTRAGVGMSSSRPGRVGPGLHIIPEQAESGSTRLNLPLSPIQSPPLALSRMGASSAYHRRVWRRDADVGGGAGNAPASTSDSSAGTTAIERRASPATPAAASDGGTSGGVSSLAMPVRNQAPAEPLVNGGEADVRRAVRRQLSDANRREKLKQKGKGLWSILTGAKGKSKDNTVRGASVAFNFAGASASGTASTPVSAPGSGVQSAAPSTPATAPASGTTSAASSPPTSPSSPTINWLGLRRGSIPKEEITYRNVSTSGRSASVSADPELLPEYSASAASQLQPPASSSTEARARSPSQPLSPTQATPSQADTRPQQPISPAPESRRPSRAEILRWETQLIQRQEDDEHEQSDEVLVAPWPYKEYKLYSRDGKVIYRGFCSWCGGSLVLRCEDLGPGARIYIQAGSLDDPATAIKVLGFVRETCCLKAMSAESGTVLGTVSGIANNKLERYRMGYENGQGELMG